MLGSSFAPIFVHEGDQEQKEPPVFLHLAANYRE